MMIHVFISNIFLLNYLVAILATVYDIMMEGGEFAYKSNKYNFIEKYSIALRNEWGYAELVIHPPPLNFLTLFLIPFMFRGQWMKTGSKIVSKLTFWFENIFYIMLFIIYEIVMCPVIFCKVIFNICRMCEFRNIIQLLLFWMLFGFVYLIFAVFKDCFYFVKILCNSQDDEDCFREKEEEDFK